MLALAGGNVEGRGIFNAGVEGGQAQAMGGGKLAKPGIGGFMRGGRPGSQKRRRGSGDETARFDFNDREGLLGLWKGVTEGLHGDADEGEFRESAGAEAGATNPLCPGMKGVVVRRAGVVPSEHGVGVEQVVHGKSARAASICS